MLAQSIDLPSGRFCAEKIRCQTQVFLFLPLLLTPGPAAGWDDPAVGFRRANQAAIYLERMPDSHGYDFGNPVIDNFESHDEQDRRTVLLDNRKRKRRLLEKPEMLRFPGQVINCDVMRKSS